MLRQGTRTVDTLQRRGIEIEIRRRFCEGPFARPGFFWLTWWETTIGDRDYGTAVQAWEPVTDEQLRLVAEQIKEDAIRIIDRALADVTP